MRLERKPTAGIDLIAIIAMALAICTIVWARIEVLGTSDIEDALSGEISSSAAPCASHAEALVRNRWIAGLNQ
ncbi:MAG TPA: hypothetical protein VGP71_04445 [Burkholderiales bacterium]|jgi:hypothetical protein|nr:hypothetical protein [Burkholderiales bacterium]